MSCVNPNDSLFKILLKELKNPLLAEIEFDKSNEETEVFNKVEVPEGEVDEELNSYISNELFKKFGVMVPNVGNDNLLNAETVSDFNNVVAINGGILPAQYYNGVNNTHKWILNKKQLYDLVDKDTSEVYLRDVNLLTGVHEEQITYSPINEEERNATINSLNDAVQDYRIDEILAEKGYDVNDIISNLEAATTQEELDRIINKLLRMIC